MIEISTAHPCLKLTHFFQENEFLNRLSNELAEERKRFQIELASVKASHDNERRTIFEEHSRYTLNI
jgi:hypothetical protein